MDKTYIDTVRLLLESAPAIFSTPRFAMKGGTAINLFIEDMPRLSVDISHQFCGSAAALAAHEWFTCGSTAHFFT